jgi:nitrogen fixation protein NifB
MIEEYIAEFEKQILTREMSVHKKVRKLEMEHPCFNEGVHGKKGRLHLPTSPSCNIQCRFCMRACNKYEQRPGVANGVLKVEEAVDIVKRALELCPDITVVGIAGPGDTLATPHGLKTFKLVHKKYPHLIKCLSTNGLALPGKAEEFLRVGIKTITVTVNAVDPVIGEKIVSHIIWNGKKLTGVEAVRILIENQLQGIREASTKGILVKVNTVLIPTINDEHIYKIAETIKKAGATIHNIIPLIPQHELKDIPAPTCVQINLARQAAEDFLPQFRHCVHCRADACGIIGKEDLSYKLYGERKMETFSHG